MAALPKRIIKETERLVSDPVPGITATPSEDNLRYFQVTIDGPESSPYSQGAPNPDDPLANDVAEDWKKDEKQAIKVAQEWTEKYAVK
ncbi:hypothetical protein QCA50_012156 [Cerrena zonata]|uniref:UBC core domain-containing protein n=1 Tax=Cerrena zonata TaxID=2478898 RepID=A0AAW0FUR2_9APHY